MKTMLDTENTYKHSVMEGHSQDIQENFHVLSKETKGNVLSKE